MRSKLFAKDINRQQVTASKEKVNNEHLDV